MKTIKTVVVEPVHVHYVPEVLEDNKLYISLEYNCVIHLCLCGCKNKAVTPIGKGGWVLTGTCSTQDKTEKVTLTPSILNNNCPNRSHYVITNNKANFI